MERSGNIENTAAVHANMDHAEGNRAASRIGQTPLISNTLDTDTMLSSPVTEDKATASELSITSDIKSAEIPTPQEETAAYDTAAKPSMAAIPAGLTAQDIISQAMNNPDLPAEARTMVQSHVDAEGASLHALAVNEPHPDTDKIIRQVEFYLSDKNLPTDAHLLSFTGDAGDGWVSINRIFGFAKMRAYKPKAKAKEALRGSTLLEVDEKLKYVRRKTPLNVPLRVSPKQSDESKMAKILIEKPWLSKAMLKPTGFEAGFTEGPLRPEEHEAERKLFDPDEAFTIRIDYAVAKYMSKRKMHQENLNVFSKFLLFGGFDGAPRQFTGGFDEKDLENYSKDEILQMKATFGVSNRVFDGLDEYQEGGATWVVDFEGMAKAFFSSHLLQHCDWMDEKVTDNATNVICNFFNYLQYHQVCPEYTYDLLNARKVCVIAQKELPKLAIAARGLPGDFNSASSTLFGGYYAMRRPYNPLAEWINPDDDTGWSDADASAIWHTALVAHCSSEQYKQFQQADEDGALASVEGHQTGLEVIEVQFPIEQVKALFRASGIKDTFIRPTGKLICKRWNVPGASRLDIPKDIIASREAKMPKQYEFLVEEDVLHSCYIGLKLEATVMKFNVGDLSYIDCVHFVYPSFYTWTLNERVRNNTHSGPPKAWMKRQNSRHNSDEGDEMAGAEGDGKEMVKHADGKDVEDEGEQRDIATAAEREITD